MPRMDQAAAQRLLPATDVISSAPAAAAADGVNMESESRKFRNAPSSPSPGHRVLPDVHAANRGPDLMSEKLQYGD